MCASWRENPKPHRKTEAITASAVSPTQYKAIEGNNTDGKSYVNVKPWYVSIDYWISSILIYRQIRTENLVVNGRYMWHCRKNGKLTPRN